MKFSRSLFGVFVFYALSSTSMAGEAEVFLLKLLSGEANTDTVWLAYEIKAKDREIEILTRTLDDVTRFSGHPGRIQAARLALEQAHYRQLILKAKQTGNAPKLQLILALTEATEKGTPVDSAKLAEPTKVFMQSRVDEARARLGVVKADQKFYDTDYRRAQYAYDHGAIPKSVLESASVKLATINTLVTDAEATLKLAEQLYADLVKEPAKKVPLDVEL